MIGLCVWRTFFIAGLFMWFSYSCGCRMCMRLYLYFRTLYGYELRNLFSLYRVQFNDGSSPLLNNYFRLQSQLQMHKLLWHEACPSLFVFNRWYYIWVKYHCKLKNQTRICWVGTNIRNKWCRYFCKFFTCMYITWLQLTDNQVNYSMFK